MINFHSILSKAPDMTGLTSRYVCACLHCSECKTFPIIIGNPDSLSGQQLNLFFLSVLPQCAEESSLFQSTEQNHDYASAQSIFDDQTYWKMVCLDIQSFGDRFLFHFHWVLRYRIITWIVRSQIFLCMYSTSQLRI